MFGGILEACFLGYVLGGIFILVGCRVNLIPTVCSALDLHGSLGECTVEELWPPDLCWRPPIGLLHRISTVAIVSQWVLGNGSSRARYAGGAVIMPLSLIRKRAFVPK